ncbi:DMT family transporter [Sphingorhabdus sp. SMR4y]|uniref:DMT family transporter n=1 Tax=Sphingorhabdus sp. SMR4y TaxID=2584094 RepID=UPI000B5C6D98|nr:DMT family transporter [Sphingorhabdus sp. SMR4y]ASK89953.1 EamA-like transporter family protein [Sphingorhabdus sp. SMR4y]
MAKIEGRLATGGLLAITLSAFAGNSLLARAALAGEQIDWAGYTIVRLVAGAIVLALLIGKQKGQSVRPQRRDLVGALSLFVYAGAFSWAYIGLDAGLGALILFPAGQITMQVIGLTRQIIPSKGQLAGAAIALVGLVYLMMPGATAPPLLSTVAMICAGMAWGVSSWAGKTVGDPSLTTARYFIGASLLTLMLFPFVDWSMFTGTGVLMAVISGGVTSALGYVLWYMMLARISITSAAVSQLSVPAIAALGGVILLGEILTARLLIGGLIILAGIGLTSWASIRGGRT